MQTTISDTGNTRGDDHAAGTKRKADESSLVDSERFFKRFNLLSLGVGADNHTNSNYYIPVAKHQTSAQPSAQRDSDSRNRDQDEVMQVDDTPNRVYIHSLDDELADVESDEEKLIFLPDIEKRLNRIPKQVLTGQRDDDHENQELVLYGIPKSLTAGEGHDSVRKAMIEARQRAREKAVEEARHHDMNCKYEHADEGHAVETAHGYNAGYAFEQDSDPDAMDMD